MMDRVTGNNRSPGELATQDEFLSVNWGRELGVEGDDSHGQLVQQLVQAECSALLVGARKGLVPEYRTGRPGRLLDVGALRLRQRHAELRLDPW